VRLFYYVTLNKQLWWK